MNYFFGHFCQGIFCLILSREEQLLGEIVVVGPAVALVVEGQLLPIEKVDEKVAE